MILEDNNNPNNHSFEQKSSTNKQEGTFKSPPIISVQCEDGTIEAYVSLKDYNAFLKYTNAKNAEKDQKYNDLEEKYKRLESELSMKNKVNSGDKTSDEYYDVPTWILNSNINGQKVASVLVNLLNHKMANKYLIENSRSWYKVYRCLKWYNILSVNCTLSNYCDFINDTILEHIDDKKRLNNLICKIDNYTSIKENSPIKMYDPPSWETHCRFDPKGCKSLKKGILILNYLKFYLKL
jgi:hypothetical protein